MKLVNRILLLLALVSLTMPCLGDEDENQVSSEIEESAVPSELQSDTPKGCPFSAPIRMSMPRLSEEISDLVHEAMNFDGAQSAPLCVYYTESSRSGRGSQIEQFIPTEPVGDEIEDPDQVGWTLISVDGQTPTVKELEEYEHRGGALFPYREYIDLLDFSQLEVTSQDENKLNLETVPTQAFLEEQDAAYLDERVTMEVVIDLNTRRLDYIHTYLNKPFRPNPFTRIRGFEQKLEFEFIPEVGEVVLTQLDMKADVKFVVVARKFEIKARLYDFSCPLALQPPTCPEIVSTETLPVDQDS